MAARFDLTAVARNLLNMEVNTIVRDTMTGEPMPPIPHALLDIAHDYAKELCAQGVRLEKYFEPDAGDAATVMPGWAHPSRPVSDQLTISPETFDRLRWAAKWATDGSVPPTRPIPPAKRVLLDRINNNADAIKEMFKRFDAGFNRQFLNKTRAQLLAITIEPVSYVVPPNDVILVQKIWDIRLEEIVVQTIVRVTGDVTTRVQQAHCGPGSEVLHAIHRQSVDVSVARWKDLLDAVTAVAGTTIRMLLGGR